MGRGEGGGGAPADVEGPQAQPGPPQPGAHGLDLPQQAVEIRRQQLARAALGLADEGAVGAAGGAEGNAHVDRDVAGLQQGRRPHRGLAGLNAEPPPGRGDEEALLQQPVRALDRAPGQQVAGGELGGPDPGEGAPGRGRGELGQGRQIVGPLQNTAAEGIVLPVQGQALDGPGADAAPGDPGRGGQVLFSAAELRHRPVPPEGGLAELHGLLRKEAELELLQGVAVGMAGEIELHKQDPF